MTTSDAVRARLVDKLRRDLIGPGPQDVDLERECLPSGETPSGWYVTGYLAPLPGTTEPEETLIEDEGDPLFGDDEGADPETGTARAADDVPDDSPPVQRTRAPSSLGLTVMVDAAVLEVDVTLTWGDYVTIPPLPDEVFVDEKTQFDPAYRNVQWQRVPGQATLRLQVPKNGRGRPVEDPEGEGMHSSPPVCGQRANDYIAEIAHALPGAERARGFRESPAAGAFVVFVQVTDCSIFADFSGSAAAAQEVSCGTARHSPSRGPAPPAAIHADA